MKEIVEILREWERRRLQPLALATLVRSRGSSYRRAGARMLISADGATVGSLSGGCLEEEVAARALDVIGTGLPELLSFDTRLRFGCNGAIDVFIERVSDSFLAEIATQLRARRSCYVRTTFGSEDRRTQLLPSLETATADSFVQELQPPIRLIVFGDGPDSSALRAFAGVLGWEIIEIEQAAQLPSTVDDRTAAIIKSHNYGRDFAALQRLLRMELPYVGLLGPRRRRDQLLHALLDDGNEINAELFAPAGLDVGAETPEEIALALVAEIQTVFANASGEALRDRKAPIHGWNLAPTTRRTAAVGERCSVSVR